MDPKAAQILGQYIFAAGMAVATVPTLLAWVAPTGPRYQVAVGNGTGFVVDTRTGQTWSQLAPSGQGHTHWEKEQGLR